MLLYVFRLVDYFMIHDNYSIHSSPNYRCPINWRTSLKKNIKSHLLFKKLICPILPAEYFPINVSLDYQCISDIFS